MSTQSVRLSESSDRVLRRGGLRRLRLSGAYLRKVGRNATSEYVLPTVAMLAFKTLLSGDRSAVAHKHEFSPNYRKVSVNAVVDGTRLPRQPQRRPVELPQEGLLEPREALIDDLLGHLGRRAKTNRRGDPIVPSVGTERLENAQGRPQLRI
jgi:hypothetical protein